MPHPVDHLQTIQALGPQYDFDKDTWVILGCTLLLLWTWEVDRLRKFRCTAVNACALRA